MIKIDGVDIPTIKYIDPVDGEVDILRVMQDGVQIWPSVSEIPNIPTGIQLSEYEIEEPYTYLLDDYPGAVAAYSLQKLSSTAVQGIMVRRDSDDQLVDVQLYDDPSKSIDLDSIIAGGGAGTLGEWVGSASAFVFNWYDQSGSGKHASQFTEASQPRIVNAGFLEIDGLYFDGSDDYLSITPNATVDEISLFTVSKYVSLANDNQSIITRRDSSNDLIQLRYATATGRAFFQLRGSGGGLVSLGSDASINEKYLLTGIMERPNPTTLFNNGAESQLSTYNWGTQTFSSTKLLIGSVDNGGGEASFLFGNIDEIIVYPNSQTANRTAIEDNINSRYNIYLTTAEVDAYLIEINSFPISNEVIEVNGVRSSASDLAVSNLISNGNTVITK